MDNEYIGKTFFHYTIIKKDEEKTRETGRQYYICKCLNCNKLFSLRFDKINNYNLVVCCPSCASKLRKTLYPKSSFQIGQILGDFLIKENLGYIYAPKTHENYWLVECIHCHQQFKKNNAHLRCQHLSCSCQSASNGEKIITDILINNKVNFKSQYRFNKLPQRIFDFAVIKNNKINYCIEYDGFQHFYETAMCHDTLKDRQKRDEEKNIFCKINNIPLIRIPFTKENEITIKDLIPETTEFLVK